jgi:transcriptional/translational regulatory protein YebC/TACO1
MEIALDKGAEEINDLGENFEIVSEPNHLVAIREAIEQAGVEYESAEVGLLPSILIPLDKESAEKIFKLIDAIEELDDVQNVYANFDVSDEILATLS